MAHNYILQVTAGSEYDITKHQIVPVNQAQPTTIHSEHISVDLNVRIQSYRGLPKNSPNSSPYFDLAPHDKNKDQYSIAFKFSPKENINGDDLVFGNDFDHPIRDRLPMGFSSAFKFVKWAIDPGLDGDVQADQPYLYGHLGSSINTLEIRGNGKIDGEPEHKAGLVFTEGGDEDGMEFRKDKGIPDTEAARKKHFLNVEKRKNWEWEAGKIYGCDFFNPYLDFNDFALRLPICTIPIMKYWDGQGLRYVLKNRKTGTVLLVVLFTLYLKEDVDENGNLKDGVEGGKPFYLMSKEQAEKHEKEKNEREMNGDAVYDEKVESHTFPDTNADDVD